MPELPEVETLRRDLQKTLPGRTITRAEVRLPKLFIGHNGLSIDDLAGRRVQELRRRAKYLIVDLDADHTMVIHLRLAGQVVHRDSTGNTLAEGGHPVPAYGAPLPHKSTHVLFHLDDGGTVYLTDIRQFGRVWLMPSDDLDPFLEAANLGPEPLSDALTLPFLRDRLARRGRMPLKPLLLDQSFVGGVGNIYADEIIFAAKLGPDTRAAEIGARAARRLHDAIKSVLTLAVTEGVAEILNGKAAEWRDFPRVHGRAGQPCPRCGVTIVKFKFGGRGTYTCPKCQPAARA
ncbi:MAG: bifunctional DNA-formamidopyrimidine glycosylase/DNA-(apurinic or apyrimidinic site) lyase [Chloroflexota bacterium]